MAVELVQEGRQGIDRKAIEQAQRESEAASISVTDALDLYYQLRLSKLRTADAAFRELRNGLAHLADLSVSQLQHNHMQKRIDAKAAEGKITAGNRLKANFSTFSKWLFQQGYTDSDLSARLAKAGKERPRDVVLSVEEVQAIKRALDGLSGPFASAFSLLILTGQRVSGPVSVSCLCGGYSLLPCGVWCLSLGESRPVCVGEDMWSPVWGRSPFTVWRAIFSGALGVSDCARCVGRVKDC